MLDSAGHYLLADTRSMTIHMRRGLCRDHAQSIRDAMTRPPAAALVPTPP
jgi:hypothetical protein